MNAKTADVEQKAQAAGQNAAAAQQMADAANNRVGVLTNTVANLDNYRAGGGNVGEVRLQPRQSDAQGDGSA